MLLRLDTWVTWGQGTSPCLRSVSVLPYRRHLALPGANIDVALWRESGLTWDQFFVLQYRKKLVQCEDIWVTTGGSGGGVEILCVISGLLQRRGLRKIRGNNTEGMACGRCGADTYLRLNPGTRRCRVMYSILKKCQWNLRALWGLLEEISNFVDKMKNALTWRMTFEKWKKKNWCPGKTSLRDFQTL